MKKIIIITFCFICFWSCVEDRFVDQDTKPQPKIGDVWMYVTNMDDKYKNPFEECDTLYFKVLDVKNGYVKYERLPIWKRKIRYVGSGSVRAFRVDSRVAHVIPSE